MVARVKAMLESMFGEKAVEIALDIMKKGWCTDEYDTADIAKFKGIFIEEARRVYDVMAFLEDHEEVM